MRGIVLWTHGADIVYLNEGGTYVNRGPLDGGEPVISEWHNNGVLEHSW